VAVNLLWLNGGNPLDELLLLGGVLLITWLVIRLTRGGKDEDKDDESDE
jgi:hypothetical protein